MMALRTTGQTLADPSARSRWFHELLDADLDRKEFQGYALAATLAWCRDTIPFYQRAHARLPIPSGVSGLGCYPVLPSSSIQQYRHPVLSDAVETDFLLFSTGSTGHVKYIHRNVEEFAHLEAFRDWWFPKTGYGYSWERRPPEARYVVVDINHGIRFMERRRGPLLLHYLPFQSPRHSAVARELLQAHSGPGEDYVFTEIRGQYAKVQLLTLVAEREGWAAQDLPIRHVLYGGFWQTERWRRRTREVWGARLLQEYGLTEFHQSYATECVHCGWYHFAPIVVEEVRDPHDPSRAVEGGVGRLYLTHLFPACLRQVMVRYDTGDLIEVGPTCKVIADSRHRAAVHLVGQDQNGTIRAGLSTYLLDDTFTPSPFVRVDRVLLRLLSYAPDGDAGPHGHDLAQLLPTLCCGTRQSADSRMLLRRTLGDRERAETVTEVLRAAEDTAHQLGARSISFLYVDERDAALREGLRDRGFSEFFSAWQCVLDVRWSSFSGYADSFDSHRRRAIRREREKLAAAGIVFTTGRLTPDMVAALAPLELNVTRRYGSPRTRAHIERSLRTIAERLERRALLVTAAQDGQVIGFALFVRSRDHLFIRHVGFDYQRQGRLPVYFGLVFYEPVEYAVRDSVTRIQYGVESYDAKLSRGCMPLPQFGYLKRLDDDVGRHMERLIEHLQRARPEDASARGYLQPVRWGGKPWQISRVGPVRLRTKPHNRACEVIPWPCER